MDNIAVFGGGCFWCTESIFLEVKGVQSTRCAYAGGKTTDPSYAQICQGDTGHAEVVEIEYDASVIDYSTLLNIFFASHDPTSLNRQVNDIGTQYRSVIFYANESQQQIAQQRIEQLQQQGIQIVTELTAMPKIYAAEDQHQQFYRKNPNQGYCNAMIPPKLHHLRQQFSAWLKD